MGKVLLTKLNNLLFFWFVVMGTALIPQLLQASTSELFDPTLNLGHTRFGSSSLTTALVHGRPQPVRALNGRAFGDIFSGGIQYEKTPGQISRKTQVQFIIPERSMNAFDHLALFALYEKDKEFKRLGVAAYPDRICIEIIDPNYPDILYNCTPYFNKISGKSFKLEANKHYSLATVIRPKGSLLLITGKLSSHGFLNVVQMTLPRPDWFNNGLNTFLGKMTLGTDEPIYFYNLRYLNF